MHNWTKKYHNNWEQRSKRKSVMFMKNVSIVCGNIQGYFRQCMQRLITMLNTLGTLGPATTSQTSQLLSMRSGNIFEFIQCVIDGTWHDYSIWYLIARYFVVFWLMGWSLLERAKREAIRNLMKHFHTTLIRHCRCQTRIRLERNWTCELWLGLSINCGI